MAASSDSEGQPCGDPGEEDGHGAALRAATLTLAWLGGAAPGEEASAAWRAFEEGRGGWTRAAAAPVERAFSVASGWDASIPVAARGVVALALVELARREGAESGAADWRESERGRRAVEAVRTTFADSTPGELVTHMPWLARAEARIVQAGGDDAGGTLDAPGLDASGVMRQMRSLLWERQVGAERAALDGADLEGAILLSGRGGMLQAPSWQTARPLTAAALMLGDARMTSGSERNAELLRVLASLRFLRQLTVDEAGAWDAVDAPRVLWGVRNGPWDQRLSVEASVGTLMALDATIDAVEGMK